MEKNDLKEYLDIIELSGITLNHKKEVKRYLEGYLEYLGYRVDKSKSLPYFKALKDTYSIATYKKEMYQILKFLTYHQIEWTKEIKLPSDPIYDVRRFSRDTIEETLSHFEKHQYFRQIHTIILLGASSGLRAEEMYQLNPEDIDLKNRIVRINHHSMNGQTTKTQRSRISFFDEEAKHAFSEYHTYFNNGNKLDKLFSETHMTHLFK